MKKTIAIFLLAVYMLSLAPQVIAEEKEEAPKANIEKREGKLQQIKARIADKRAIAKESIEQAKANFQKAKQRLVAAKERFQETRSAFLRIKEKLTSCKGNESGECSTIKEQIKEKAKDHLINIADKVLEHINKLKAKVQESEDLSEGQAEDMISTIEGHITAVEDAKSTIVSAESKEDIQEAIKTVKRRWARIGHIHKIQSGKMVNARIGGIIVKSERLRGKIENILEEMEENGKDTAEIQEIFDEFNALIGEAKDRHIQAVERFKQAKDSDPADTELIREAQGSMREAHSRLKEAKEKLRDIIKEIKQADGNRELQEAEEEEENMDEEETENQEESEGEEE